jgi:hypothetical protein
MGTCVLGPLGSKRLIDQRCESFKVGSAKFPTDKRFLSNRASSPKNQHQISFCDATRRSECLPGLRSRGLHTMNVTE